MTESNRAAESVPNWLRQIAAVGWRVLIVFALVYLVDKGINRFYVVILPMAGALFISTILYPPARWLRRHKVPPALATWVVFLASLGLLTAVGLGLYPSIDKEFAQLTTKVSAGASDVRSWLETGPLHLSPTTANSVVASVPSRLSEYKGALLNGVLTGVTTALEAAATLVLTLVFTFFFVKDGPKITDGIINLFGASRKSELRELKARAWHTLSWYIRGTAANGLVNATVLSVGLLVLDVPLVLPIAVLTFIGGFLPILGAIISGGIAALVALVVKGPLTAVIVLAITVLVHHLEGYVVGPLVLGRAVKLHPLAIILALTVGSLTGGILGAFIAVPLTALVVSVVGYYRDEEPAPEHSAPADLPNPPDT